MSKYLLLIVLGVLTLARLIRAQDQSGFISIDCGLQDESSYTDVYTGIYYSSDETFIETGENRNIGPEVDIVIGPEFKCFKTVRSFPEGKRNCYTLRPEAGNNIKYLVRASFMYGNWDSNDSLPTFVLLLDADIWETVDLYSEGTEIATVYKEVIYTPQRDYIYVCLVDIGKGTPFISSLELRPLNTTAYVIQSGSLQLIRRWDIGSRYTIRYKDDVYDRVWDIVDLTGYRSINTTHNITSLSNDEFRPPSAVMKTACVPENGSFLQLYWDDTPNTTNYFACLYFAEIEELLDNQKREFNIFLNGQLWYGPLAPSYLSSTSVCSSMVSRDSTLGLFINKTRNSTLPPLLNGYELYHVRKFQSLLTDQRDVDAIKNIKLAYNIKKNWQGDPCAPKDYLWEGLQCNYSDIVPPRITVLNLSSNGLSSEILLDIANLRWLESLDLSNNHLKGTVPQFLAQLAFLKFLNLTGNQLIGSVPIELIKRRDNGTLRLSVDATLCQSISCQKKSKVVIVASIVPVAIFLAASLVILYIHIRRKLNNGKRKLSKKQEQKGFEAKARRFAYYDILMMTNNFEREIGKGGFGEVYYGNLESSQVAVKMLTRMSVEGYKAFQAEVQILVRVHHRNLTRLVGYCDEGDKKALVYEYMANGDLEAHILGRTGKILSWEERLRIAIDAAQGCKPPVIHRDIKTTNILLGETFQAKLSDFGISKVFTVEGQTHLTTGVAGTPGFLDPEYSMLNRLTEKSDVYSFGVVLLQIITSRPVISGTRHISQWVRSVVENGDVESIVDPKLGDYSINSIWKIVETSLNCASLASDTRPTMSQVVIEVKTCLEIEMSRKRETQDDKTEEQIEMAILRDGIEEDREERA